MRKIISLDKIIYLLFFSFLISCTTNNQKILILSKDNKDHFVREWIEDADSTIKIVEFYNLPEDSLQYYLTHSDGIIMCGGEDINPKLYKRPDFIEICGKIDNRRDSLELILLEHAMKNKKPLLAICRGYQLLNVFNGGTLLPDIPTFVKDTSIHHRIKDNGLHPITCIKDSWIDKQFKENDFLVNSKHHQCIDRIAKNFKVAAKAPDGVIESIELKDSKDDRFLIGVQWHPESLSEPMSNYLRKTFLENLYRN